jgi:hypothetical protein
MFAEIDEARKTLDRTDASLFKAETGQIEVTAEQWDELEALGDTLVDWLADALSALTPKSKEEVKADFTKIRSLNRIQMTLERFVQLHPESRPEADELIRRTMDSNNPMRKDDVETEWTQLFGPMFIERPRAKRGFFRRLLGRE